MGVDKMNFKESKTMENLMRAFAGESQAANRYRFAANTAKKSDLYVIEAVFEFTAKQEEAHAKVYYDLLGKNGVAGNNIEIDGNYPVDIYDDILPLLRAAEHNETQEYKNDYRQFGEIAQQEGFYIEANRFFSIAEIEKTHAERFKRVADLYEQGKLFMSDSEVHWMCLNCGFVFKGKQPPKTCPVCEHNRGFYIRLELSPYSFNSKEIELSDKLS